MFIKLTSLFFFIALYPSISSATVSFESMFHLINQGTNFWTFSIETFIFFTLLSFISAGLLMMTSFTRIIIVFSLLRNALGTPYSPPNQVLVGLSLFLTFFIMSPVLDKIYHTAYIPFQKENISLEIALKRSIIPIHNFMKRQTKSSDLLLFFDLAKIPYVKKKSLIPMRILLPAYMISELKTAFQIGFTIFIPFLIIDLVVASVLMALGMMMVSPSTISLPFKLILFVLADGWRLLIMSLSQSFLT
ncbi:type III protein export, membrane component [Buchnera aphidicola (Cinara tujafilina)]|uniref:Flagellar biosynthetic protein FliP n=1 Tax=Buchnera aphidicola (Cinara tujafilina) TaxID=261317 RepID=F7WYZ2_9GAMM|nr:flagellar type III secretion system pore protein FliP [Buchnera aphidicola]AEH39642.1 type III protein export, membrane component [Buchnera aphidicola (Cinara tujafilina)]